MILARFTEEDWKDENGDGDGLFILHIQSSVREGAHSIRPKFSILASSAEKYF